MPRAPIARYGIAEWFGRDITTLTPEERQAFGQLAAKQDQDGDLSAAAGSETVLLQQRHHAAGRVLTSHTRGALALRVCSLRNVI